jgi:hypothetical protein
MGKVKVSTVMRSFQSSSLEVAESVVPQQAHTVHWKIPTNRGNFRRGT